MKTFVSLLALLASLLPGLSVHAATPEQEKAFVASYRKALEAGDEKALSAFLYTEGAKPEQIEFFKMMMMAALEPGGKIESIELVTPTAAEAARFNQPMKMPDGVAYKMPIIPTRQLVIVVKNQSANGSGTSTSKSPVAEKDGKFVIPVPVPAK